MKRNVGGDTSEGMADISPAGAQQCCAPYMTVARSGERACGAQARWAM